MDVGTTLPGIGHDLVAFAQHAEGLGLESLWHGDHLTGTPEQVAERFAAFAEAGVDRVVAMPFTDDRFRQTGLIAEATVLV